MIGWLCRKCRYKVPLSNFEVENITLIKSEKRCPKCGGIMVPYLDDDVEDEVLSRAEARKKARLRTRGPYRKALLW